MEKYSRKWFKDLLKGLGEIANSEYSSSPFVPHHFDPGIIQDPLEQQRKLEAIRRGRKPQSWENTTTSFLMLLWLDSNKMVVGKEPEYLPLEMEDEDIEGFILETMESGKIPPEAVDALVLWPGEKYPGVDLYSEM